MDEASDNSLNKLLLENAKFIAKLKPYREDKKSSNLSFPYYIEKSQSVFYEMTFDLKTMIHVNQAVKNVWRLSKSQCKKNISNWFNTINPEDRPRVKKALLDIVTSDVEEMTLEYRLLYDDLSSCYITDKVILIKDEFGKPNSIMGIATDRSDYFHSQKILLIYEQILTAYTHKNTNNEFFDTVLKTLATSFDWDYAEFWVFDEIKSFLYCTDVWNSNRKIDTTVNPIEVKLGADFNGYVAKQNNPVLVSDISKESKYTRLKRALACNYKSALGVNIKNKARLTGQIFLFSKMIKVPGLVKLKDYTRISRLIVPMIEVHAADKMRTYQTCHHPATGFLNLYGFELVVDNALKNIKQITCAIIIIDLEGLEAFIDFYGYSTGQKLSHEVVMHIQNRLLPVITVIAYISETKIGLLAEKLNDKPEIDAVIKAIQNIFNKPFTIEGMSRLLTHRVGVSLYPGDGTNARALIDNANVANTFAKKTGRRDYQLYTKSLLTSIKRFLDIENALRQAIAENKLYLVYQPKVNLISGQITGVEVLTRWHDPVLGEVSPAEFISIAEQSDLIISLGEWVFFEALTHFPILELNIPVSINISARNLSPTYDLVAFITKILKDLNLPGRLIDLELTEYQLAYDSNHSAAVLKKLKNEQVTISIDDFGTGFSSFEYLKLFRPEAVKIDKNFVDGIPNNLENLGILRAVIALSKSLGIKTIAEGVETKEQVDCLIDEGCDEMQGFYFSRPVSITQLKELLKRSDA